MAVMCTWSSRGALRSWILVRSPSWTADVLGEGRVVGEMAFIDQAPRVADVRATEPAKIRHWQRDDPCGSS